MDDSTFGGQVEALGADSPGVYVEPAAQAAPVANDAIVERISDPNTFGGYLDGLLSGTNNLEEGFDEPAEDPVSVPVVESDPEQEAILAFARSPLGQRMLAEGQKLVEQHGSADTVLEVLNTPVIDEGALIQQAWDGPVAALLQATDEFGDPKYTQDDPIVQALVVERYERLRENAMLQGQQSRHRAEAPQARVQNNQETALGEILKAFPSADPESVRVALSTGADAAAVARRSHSHVENMLTQTRARLAESSRTPQRQAPRPLTPGNRVPGSGQGNGVPNPFTDSRAFAALERQMIAEGNKNRR